VCGSSRSIPLLNTESRFGGHGMFAMLRVVLVAIMTALMAFALDQGVNACVYPYSC
jgi:hypothetical protein